jgi:hypothetical protein
MCLIYGLPILECLSTTLHDFRNVSHYRGGVKVAGGDDCRKIAPFRSQNQALFNVAQDRKIRIVRCDNDLPS